MRAVLAAILGFGMMASPAAAEDDADLFAELVPGVEMTDAELSGLFGAGTITLTDFTVTDTAISRPFIVTKVTIHLPDAVRMRTPRVNVPRISLPRLR